MKEREQETTIQKVSRIGVVISMIVWMLSILGDGLVNMSTSTVILIFTLFNPLLWTIIHNIK